MDYDQSPLDLEIELIQSSLLSGETLEADDALPRVIDITSSASKLAVHVEVREGYPDAQSVHVEVKGSEINRDEAEGWRTWVKGCMADWDETAEWVSAEHRLPFAISR